MPLPLLLLLRAAGPASREDFVPSPVLPSAVSRGEFLRVTLRLSLQWPGVQDACSSLLSAFFIRASLGAFSKQASREEVFFPFSRGGSASSRGGSAGSFPPVLLVVEELRGEGVRVRSHRPSRPARQATVASQSRNEVARIRHFV